MATSQYSVLKSKRDTLTVKSQNSTEYIDMIRSGNYTEVYVGDKRDCEDWKDEHTYAPSNLDSE